MKTAAIAFILSATVTLAGERAWKQQNARFAIFQTPATMARDTNANGVDSIMDAYESRDIILTYDSEVRVVPARLQKQFERTVTAWVAERKENWRKSTYVDDGGAIHGYDHDPDATSVDMPYYLYFGFAVGDNGTFAIHIRFRSLERLDDIERILKSIKFKTK